jgi:hypothetical protein
MVSVRLYHTAATTYDLVFYDDTNSVVMTVTLDSDFNNATAAYRNRYVVLPSDIEYPGGNVVWRCHVKPSSATLAARMFVGEFAALAHIAATAPGMCASSATDGVFKLHNNGTDGYWLAQVTFWVTGGATAIGPRARYQLGI